tara:strand:- start:1110 stop:1598 length:489 start_codon:yes stop_codon:yes gene_type:complete
MMEEKEIYSFLYMLHELKIGKALYDAPCDFDTDFNNVGYLGYINNQGTDEYDTLYRVMGYNEQEDVDVVITPIDGGSDITVAKIKTCYTITLNSIPSLKLNITDITQRITYLKALIHYFDSKPEEMKMLKMFENNHEIVRKISSKPNFKLTDMQPILDLIST